MGMFPKLYQKVERIDVLMLGIKSFYLHSVFQDF